MMMKQVSIICLMATISLFIGCNNKEVQKKQVKGAGSAANKLQYKNVLSPKGGKSFALQLTKDGKPAVQILVPDNPSSIDEKAADMLKNALDAGTGMNFSIVKEKEYTSGPVISIGNTLLYGKSGIKPDKDLELDGYMIAEKDGNTFLIGGSRRGSISPVIALIEEDLGGRLYSRHDGLQMPELSDVQTVVAREYVPVFKIRTMFQYESFNADFQLFNRVGSATSSYDKIPQKWGGSTCWPQQYFVHTFIELLPNELYDTHPEYFALIDGRRMPQGHGGGAAEFCLTNPDARRIATDNVLKALKKYHKYRLFSVSMNDSIGTCQCDKCQAIAKREGGAAGPLLDFVNHVAGIVKKKYPDVMITTLAYQESNKPPKDIRPDDNVIIRLANDTASAPYPMFFLEESDVFYPNMKNWEKLGAKLFIWDYVVDYKAWPMPRPNLPVIDHNINTYAKEGVYGLFLQSSHYGCGENQGRLRAWVYSKKMWDPSRKMDDLIRDFNYGYFGKAADLMQEYSDLLTAEWKNFHDNHTYKDSAKYPMKFAFSDEFYPKARAIFEKALKLTEDDKKLHDKVEFEYISILFYRLQMMPPKGDKDRQSYIADLKTFSELTEKYKVDWINEKVTKTKQRIIEWKRKYNIRSADDKPVVVHLGNSDANRVGDGAKKIDDISAPGGECIKIPIRGNAWAVQWFFGSALYNDVDYFVRVQVRADKKKSNGPAFVCGVYSVSAKKVPLQLHVNAEDLADTGYNWLDVGNVNGSDAPSSYFYIAQIENSAISHLYVSAVEFIPEGTPGYKKIMAKKSESSPGAVIKKGANGEIIFPAASAKLQGSARRIGDAVSIAPSAKGWETQWQLGKNVPVGKYNVRAYVKVTGPKAGNGIRFGIYSPKAKGTWMNYMSSVADMTAGAYQWINLGEVNIPMADPDAYLFACSFGDNSFDSFLIKSVEFKAVK